MNRWGGNKPKQSETVRKASFCCSSRLCPFISPVNTNIRFKFYAIATRSNSPLTLSEPHHKNCRNPITDFTSPLPAPRYVVIGLNRHIDHLEQVD